MLKYLSLSTQISALTASLIARICSESRHLQDIRSETAHFVKVTQADQKFDIPSPPRLEIDARGLHESCALLKVCLKETLRLDTFPVTIFKISDDVVPDGEGLEGRSSRVEVPECSNKSSYILITLPAVNCPGCVEPRSPSSQSQDGDALGVEAFRPWSRPHSQAPESAFVAEISLAFAIGVLALWDIQLISGSRPMATGPLEFPSVVRAPSQVTANVFRRRID